MNDASALPLPAHLHVFHSADGPLAYRDTGQDGTAPGGTRAGSPVVVLLHAGFLDHTMWDDQVPYLTARGYRLIVPDTRGHGWSANATRPFAWADDLAALLRHLGTGPAVLAGVSMGATIAVETAVLHPELVRALVISGGGVRVDTFEDPWARKVREAELRALAAGDVEAWLDATADWAAGPHRTTAEVRPGVVRRLREMQRRTITKHTPDEPDRLLPGPDAAVRASEIAVPVLGVHGSLDLPELIAVTERITGAVRDGSTLTVEGAGHFPGMEQPETFNRILGDFLAGLPPLA